MLIDAVTASYEKFFFGEVGRETYDFFWSDYADWYFQQLESNFMGQYDLYAVTFS